MFGSYAGFVAQVSLLLSRVFTDSILLFSYIVSWFRFFCWFENQILILSEVIEPHRSRRR